MNRLELSQGPTNRLNLSQLSLCIRFKPENRLKSVSEIGLKSVSEIGPCAGFHVQWWSQAYKLS